MLHQGRLDQVLSCPAFSGTGAGLNEQSCIWAEGAGGAVQQRGRPGYDGTLWSFAAGGQTEVKKGWFAGFALGFEDARYDATDGLSNSEGDTFYAGLSAKREIGQWLVSGAVVGSYGKFDIRRQVTAPGNIVTATATSDLATIGARGRVAYTLDYGLGYIRPSAQLDVIHTHAGGYTERDAGLFNLKVASRDQTALVATPGVEIGARYNAPDGLSTRIFARGGVSLSTDDGWTTVAGLSAGPPGSGTFNTELPAPDVLGRVAMGLHLMNLSSGLDLRAEYGGSFGNDYSSHGGMLRLSMDF